MRQAVGARYAIFVVFVIFHKYVTRHFFQAGIARHPSLGVPLLNQRQRPADGRLASEMTHATHTPNLIYVGY